MKAKETDADSVKLDPKRWAALLVLLVSAFMDLLDGYRKDTTGTSFAASFQTLLWVFIGITAVVFFLLFAVPRRLREESGEEADAEPAQAF